MGTPMRVHSSESSDPQSADQSEHDSGRYASPQPSRVPGRQPGGKPDFNRHLETEEPVSAPCARLNRLRLSCQLRRMAAISPLTSQVPRPSIKLILPVPSQSTRNRTVILASSPDRSTVVSSLPIRNATTGKSHQAITFSRKVLLPAYAASGKECPVAGSRTTETPAAPAAADSGAALTSGFRLE
jgi:hypothetical protein